MSLRPYLATLLAFAVAACTSQMSDPTGDAASSEASTYSGQDRIIASTPEKHFLVNALVDRFAVKDCLEARLVYAGRENAEQDRIFHLREFQAPDSCAQGLIAAFDDVGFSANGAGVFAAGVYGGLEERVRIASTSNPGLARIEWEVDLE